MAAEAPRRFKRLVLCLDGTWQDSDTGWKPASLFSWSLEKQLAPTSNVTKISRSVRPTDSKGVPQIIFYQPGIGTGWTLDNRILGGALGFGLSANIREAYDFVANNHAPGDEIVLTGFSRGAFTARSVSGLISSVGVLERAALRYFPYVFADWESTLVAGYEATANKNIPGFSVTVKADDPSYQAKYMAELQRLGLTREVNIKAVGVFETVGALGIPLTPFLQRIGFPTALRRFRFYDTALDNHIEHAYQALALDERRSTFAPCLWDKQPGSTTELVQCWFPGVHSNVGGSYETNGIGEIALAWMMSRLAPHVEFDRGAITAVRAADLEFLARSQAVIPRVWGNGTIVDSARFPRSLLGVRERTPGRYHNADAHTGLPIEAQPKLHSEERVHASVRARVRNGGPGIGHAAGPGYFPKALQGWQLEPADEQAKWGTARWVYRGPKHGPQIEVLPEDELGDIELELLAQFEKEAARGTA